MVSPESLMARALRLAGAGRSSTHPNPRVGCVIVRQGVVVGEGAHLQAGEPHAEVYALRQAGDRARGAELFVTLEPCNHHGRTPPSVDALIAAGVKRVYVAMTDPNPRVAGQGLARLRAAGIEVVEGLATAEAVALNRGFLSRMQRGRPWVTLKLGASLDGRTAMASGESQWITGPTARADVHRLRAEAGAVLTSAATVQADDPSLSVRDWAPDPHEDWTAAGIAPRLRQPDRIVLDRGARVSPTARVWAPGARRFWCTAAAPAAVPEGVVAVSLPLDARGSLDLPAALTTLARQEVNAVLVECGPRLAGALLQAGLVDELVLYLAPSLLGHEARPLATLPGLTRLDERVRLHIDTVSQVGDDLRITATPTVH